MSAAHVEHDLIDQLRRWLGDLGDQLGALDLDAELAPDWQPFLQVQLSHDGLEPGYRARVDEIAAGFPVRLLPTTLARRDAGPDAAGAEGLIESVRLQELQPLEMFRQAFAEKHTRGPGEAHERAFHETLAAAAAEI
jgi:exonuclease SbcD